jgi:uncharacterized cupin superfamily protein
MIYVLSGELGVTVEATEHLLESGDAMYFDSSVPPSYRRTGRKTCSALIFSVARGRHAPHYVRRDLAHFRVRRGGVRLARSPWRVRTADASRGTRAGGDARGRDS